MKKSYRAVSAEEAVKVIKSGDHVHISSVSNAPQCLIKALCERGRKGELQNVYIHHLHTEGAAPYVNPEFEGIFQHNAFFVGANVRESVQKGLADYIPIFLGETSKLYREGYLKCNVAMIQVCPPDKYGYVSLGTSVDATLAAMESAEFTIAVVNKYVPRSLGDSQIPIDKIDYFVEDNTTLPCSSMEKPDETEKTIGRYCAELIEDGACLQMGIGSIPNATLSCLKNHKNLGIHTEMFSDGILDLVKKGVINGSEKKLDRNKIVSSFVMGSQKVYNFIDRNPEVLMKDVEYTNDPFIIAQQPKMTSINSAIQIDISGQVCADSLGDKIYSGVGGQIDFVYGASRAKRGKAIIAMPSVTHNGINKIVPTLANGAGAVTTRNHIHWLVTEYGAVNLYGRSLQERAKLIISIANPKFQEELEKAAFKRFGPHYQYVCNNFGI
ncbi:MAG: 4-hydroxybutyrate CoA-transferase [Bacteroidales bacterium]|jgi:acyl-CoA hydrolase|nr:4-hydroxybutyrate CoA-transferase [Bacteroidales bacterium]MCI2145398.1 4-hydroxybutyrate CoA-transferase [Bacteroidales bacterium]